MNLVCCFSWNVILTGGKLWVDRVQRSYQHKLHKLSRDWKVHVSKDPSMDALNGAKRIPYDPLCRDHDQLTYAGFRAYSDLTFSYGCAVQTPTLPPVQ